MLDLPEIAEHAEGDQRSLHDQQHQPDRQGHGALQWNPFDPSKHAVILGMTAV
jgi:hypothetical protein